MAWWDAHTEITDDMVRSTRKHLGSVRPLRNQWNTNISRDTLFHAAIGSGDDNPLWVDEEYAAKTRWGRRLAPPSFIQSITYGTRYPLDKPGQPGGSMLAGLPGIGSYWLGTDVTWFGPLMEGDEVRGHASMIASIDSDGDQPGDRVEGIEDLAPVYKAWEQFVGSWTARTMLQVGQCDIYREPQHELAVRVTEYGIRMPRGLPVEDGPYGSLAPASYSQEQIDEALAIYAGLTRRGAEPRRLADLTAGEELSAAPRGPLSVTGMRAYGAACGSNFAMGDALLYRYLHDFPGANSPHEDTGVPDVPNRVHWDTDMARTLGMPRGYDFGPMRMFWFGSYVTDWAGDDAYLRRLRLLFPSPLFLWEMMSLRATVAETSVAAHGPTVSLNLTGENVRGVITTGSADVVLAE
jgi:acyl dehydratase